MATRSTSELFELAVNGDEDAWAELVDRLSPAIWGATRACGLTKAQAEDVFGTVWLRLLDKHETIRDPERLAGWIQTTARYEALAIVRSQARFRDHEPREHASTDEEVGESIERDAVSELLWAGLNELDDRCVRLLRLLTSVPKVPYKVIAQHLEMRIGSIGPTRDRCLEKLRATPQVVEILGSNQ